jgi:signal transduction histidine kinase/CheY-like chemotaxis protein
MVNGGGHRRRLLAAVIGVEERQWRDQVLTGLGWTAASASTLGTLMVFSTRDLLSGSAWGASAVFFLLVAVLRGRVSYHARVWLILSPITISALIVLLKEGFIPNAPLALLASVIFATLLLGKRWGLVLVALESTAMAVITILHHTGSVTIRPGYEAFAALSPAAIVRFVMVFAVVAASTVVAMSYLLNRTAGLLLEKAAALERLGDEQRHADRMRNELALQEEALRKSREVEILARLAGSVAHDFNNALLIIAANADLVRQDPEYLETGISEIQSAVLQATSTTRQLRAFSPQAPAPPRVISLGETVERTAKMLTRVLPTNVAVHIDIQGVLTVMADEGQLQGLVTNLALNARDAMPHGGNLSFRVREANTKEVEGARLGQPCALMEVTDDGVGMSEETLVRLFEPYFTTKGAAGTGLGLASVKTLVESSGGRVIVTSAPGKGTQFRVLWPLHAPPSQRPAQAAAPAARSAGIVLLVEDDAHVRAAMSRTLGWSGFTVLEAGSGEEALTVARRYRGTIDVLLSDCVMPGMSVRQMIEGFRGLFPDARVALCSGYAPEEVTPPRDMIDAFVTKPITIDALTRLVGDLVDHAQRKEEKTSA